MNDIDRRIADTVRTETARQHALSDHGPARDAPQTTERLRQRTRGRERRTRGPHRGAAEPSGRNARPAVPAEPCVERLRERAEYRRRTEVGDGKRVRREDHGLAAALAYANSAQAAKAGKTAPNVAGPNRDNAAPPAGPEDKRRGKPAATNRHEKSWRKRAFPTDALTHRGWFMSQPYDGTIHSRLSALEKLFKKRTPTNSFEPTYMSGGPSVSMFGFKTSRSAATA